MSTKTLAPCGTRAARQRHQRRNEPCNTCTPIKPAAPLAPCGTALARRRHRRNNETCQVCDTALKPRGNKPAPCGTTQARERHTKRGETCQTCGPAKQPQPCGTDAAIKRHRYHGEPVCDTCKQHDRERAQKQRRQKGIPQRISNADFIEELEFLLNAGEGEKRILEALGYTGRPHTLHQRLYRTKRHDLATRIFGYELAA